MNVFVSLPLFACQPVLLYNEGVTIQTEDITSAEHPDDDSAPTAGSDAAATDRLSLQRESEARLRAEDQLQSIFELSPDMVCIFDHEAGRFLRVNPAFSHVLGYSEQELIERPIADFLHPDDVARTEQIVRENLAQGDEVVRFVNRYRSADGTYHWLEWNARLKPELRVTYGVARDITERKQFEDSLRLSEETLRAFLNAIGESAYIINADGIVLEHNNLFADRLGMKGMSLRGKSLFDLIPAETIKKRRSRIDEVLKSGKGGHMEDERGGRFVFSSLYPIKEADGAVVKIAVLGQDITWLRRAEEVMLLNEERLESLLNLSQMSSASEEEIRTYALEEAISLTRSAYGFLIFVNEDLGCIDEVVWSHDVRHACMIADASHAPLTTAGFWAESFRQRRAVFQNTPHALAEREKMPAGHLPIMRHLSVPVFDAEKIIAVAGVANKESPYDETDAAQLGLYMHTMWAILKQRRASEVLKRCSLEDPLTGLANRRRFDESFEQECRRALREKQTLSLFFVDIDFFKKYNDIYGHQAGDECLKVVAGGLKTSLNRAGDLIARYGGEEFVAILPNTELAGAIKIGETMRERVIQLAVPHEGSTIAPVVTISIGVVACSAFEDMRPLDIIEYADRALYEAKKEGRNRIRWQVVQKP